MKIVQVIFILIFLQFTGSLSAQVRTSPAIEHFGSIWAIDSVDRPDPNLDYKIVIDLKTRVGNAASINPGLNNVARMLNLHVTGGITMDRLNVTVAIHGGATPIVLNNNGYAKKYNMDNPNLEIIRDLKESGVKIYVCSQSLIARGYEFEEVNPDVEKALSMLTVVTEKMMQGYGLLVFD